MAYANLVALNTLIKREIARFIRIWPQTILPPIITTSLYFVIFGNLIGPRIGDMAGFPYMQYIAPGLIMMSVITNAYANVVSSFYGSRFQRNIEEMLIAPIPSSIILMGFIAGGIARGIMTGLTVTCIALFFTHLTVSSVFITFSVVLLCSLLFSLAGFTNAIFAKRFDDISIIPTFVLTPLTYFGGIFYSINLLPTYWQSISLANPILYMVNTFRFGILGVSDVNITTAFIMIGVCILSLWVLNIQLLRHGVGIRT